MTEDLGGSATGQEEKIVGTMGGALHLQVWLELLPADSAGTDNIVIGANIETVFILYRDISSRNIKTARNYDV